MKKLLIALALVFQLSQPLAVSHSVDIERVYDVEHDIMVMTVIDDNGESWTFEDCDTAEQNAVYIIYNPHTMEVVKMFIDVQL
nr:MAG TPA: vitamin B12-binding protein [Caudoviricetes sp.]